MLEAEQPDKISALQRKKLLTPLARAQLLLADIKMQDPLSEDTRNCLNNLERQWNYNILGVHKTFKELGVDIL